MSKINVCRTCDVPLRVCKQHNWNSNGTITQKRDPDHRIVFFDSNGLNVLFANIEHLIGVPIEKIVIESKARATLDYIKKLIRGPKGTLARVIGLERIIRKVVEQGKLMGYGDIRVTELNWKESYMIVMVEYPYCLPLFCGDMKGSNEAIRKIAGTVSYEEVAPGRFEVKSYKAPHAPELEDRLLPKAAKLKPGDINYNRCPGCGIPLELTRLKWDLDRGTITDPNTNIRMALFGPLGLQVVFDELERELGEMIPEAVVEAQRMHTESLMNESLKSMGREEIRRWLAIRGLGNLVHFEADGDSVSGRVENPAMPLIITGTAIGFYEYITGRKASARWSVSDDGDLSIDISPTG